MLPVVVEIGPAIEHRRQARRDLGVERVEPAHDVADQPIAGAVDAVEGMGVVHAEGADQGADLVRILQRESRVVHQLLDLVDGAAGGHLGLHGKPLVHDQRIVAVALFELGQQHFGRVQPGMDHRGQRGETVGHVVGVLVDGHRVLRGLLVARADKQRQHGVGQAARAYVGRIEAPLPAGPETRKHFVQRLGQPPGEQAPQPVARGVDGVDGHRLVVLRQFGLGGQLQQHCGQRRIVAVAFDEVFDNPSPGRNQQLGLVGFPVQVVRPDRAFEHPRGKFAPGHPARHRVGVEGQQRSQLAVGGFGLDLHRRGKAAQKRKHGLVGQAGKADRGCRLAQLDQVRLARRAVAALTIERCRQCKRLAFGAQQSQPERNVQRTGVLVVRMAGQGLRQADFQCPCGLVILGIDRDHRRADLPVPTLELLEVDLVGVGHGSAEVVAGHGLTVVAFEVQVHAAAEAVGTQQRVVHAHDLGALLVDRGGIEVVDLDVALGPDRVRHGSGVFRELARHQVLDVADALDRARLHVGRELLFAEDGQALLERQLEPVAAGHPIAGPVVEVLVRDYRLDGLEVGIGGGVLVGQDVTGVENI